MRSSMIEVKDVKTSGHTLRSLTVAVGIIVGWCMVTCCRCQSEVAFDVVSVKLNRDADTSELVQTKTAIVRPAYHPLKYTPGRVACSLPLISLIREAYSVEYWQIEGPQWLYDGVYDVVALLPASTTRETARLMFRTMLADRFGLRVHWSSKELPVYELVAGNKPPKLKPSDIAETREKIVQPGHLLAKIMSLNELADWLRNMSDRPVFNKTALDGPYDFELKRVPEYADPPPCQYE